MSILDENIIPIKQLNDHSFSIDNDEKFGNVNVPGVQHKGLVNCNNNIYFVKLDDLNPNKHGKWENGYDYHYSSISEAITSVFIKNIQNKENFDSVVYNFATIDYKGQQKTGTYSDIYLRPHEVECVLATDNNIDMHPAMDIKDYNDEIYEAPLQQKFNNIAKRFEKVHMKSKDTKRFLIQQAAFDIFVGNQDRLNNPGNFIVAMNQETLESRMINFDYGRTLQMLWTDQTETYTTFEDIDEDTPMFSKMITSNNESLLSGLSQKEALNFLNQNGFKPFQIDRSQLLSDLSKLRMVFENSDIPCQKFAITKLEAFKEHIRSEKFNDFCIDISKTKQLTKTEKTPEKESTFDFSL